jgi:long-chain acyl-CoA synthetase
MLPDKKRFNLGYLVTPTAETDPDRPAIIDMVAGSERTTSYGQLDRRLNQVASFFQDIGLVPGDRIAVLVGNRAEFIEVVYGALRGGFIPVMVNTKLGLDGLAKSISEVSAICAVVDPDCTAIGIDVANQLPLQHRILLGGDRPGWLRYEDVVGNASPEFVPPELTSTDIADFCFTSGSSGVPKAVMTSHRALLMKLYIYSHMIRSMVGGEIRTLVALPIFHANGRLSIGSAFQTGGVVVIQQKFDAREALRNLSHYRISYFLGVAPAYTALLKETDLLAQLDFSSLRYLWVGSASSGGDLLPRVCDALKVKVIHTYGTTEAGVVMQAEPAVENFASCGRPFPGVDVKIVDVDTGRSENFGELWIRSESLASGYWNRPELTAEKFTGGWYRSGDLFQRDENGLYFFRGRVDEMFNIGGEKVYPTDIEAILQRHPDILSVCVTSIPHDAKGEVPAAMVILVPGSGVMEEDIKQFFLRAGPAYAHPRKVLFTEAFPLAPTGKIDRVAVKKILSQPSASPAGQGA